MSKAIAKALEPAGAQGGAIAMSPSAAPKENAYLYIHDAVPMAMPDVNGNTRFLLECYRVWDAKAGRFAHTISKDRPVHVMWTGKLHRFHGDDGLNIGGIHSMTDFNVVTYMPNTPLHRVPEVSIGQKVGGAPKFRVRDLDGPCRLSFQDVAAFLPSAERQIAIYAMIDQRRAPRVYDPAPRKRGSIIGGGVGPK